MKQVFALVVSLCTVLCVVSCTQTQPATEKASSAAAVEAKSQAINQISYDADAKTLVLGFERGTYSYADVPAEVHEALLKSDSQGNYFQSEIKGKYKATRITK